MGIRTIIEINHDNLRDVLAEVSWLLSMLPSKSEKELMEEFRHSSVIKVLAQRDSYRKIKLEVE